MRTYRIQQRQRQEVRMQVTSAKKLWAWQMQSHAGHVRFAGSSLEGGNLLPRSSCIAGGINIPHPAKAETGGEDAFFISRGAVGVADGVSAWAREGVNAALYSS